MLGGWGLSLVGIGLSGYAYDRRRHETLCNIITAVVVLASAVISIIVYMHQEHHENNNRRRHGVTHQKLPTTVILLAFMCSVITLGCAYSFVTRRSWLMRGATTKEALHLQDDQDERLFDGSRKGGK
eukprot:TRINITY_DN13419_c0_g1_i1.p1 TRINITY_DN13419_c0_g1~~TRINITY_DN13419_c0_g1_i1.p1  ORF type:complete len:134 (+),score=10.20 TRINITY_DN13419_c0_g1_i1:23-403(+)